MSQSSNLHRLQQIDSQTDHARVRIHEIDIILSANIHLKEAQERAAAAEAKFQNAKKSLHQAENAVQDQRIKIELTEASLYGGKVRNPKELQDLQNESVSQKRYLSVLEDRQLEIMLELEEAETEFQQAKATLDIVQGRVAEEQSSLLGEQTNLIKTLERLAIERQAATTAVNPIDLELYDQLRQQRRGVAVTKVSTDKTCSSCGSMLTPALIQAASSPNQIVRCSSCGRILYTG